MELVGSARYCQWCGREVSRAAPLSKVETAVATAEPVPVATTATTSAANNPSGDRAESVGVAAVKTETNLLKPTTTETAHANRPLTSGVIGKSPTIPATPPRRPRPIVLAAGAVVVAAISVGVYGLSLYQDSGTAPAQPATTLAAKDPTREVTGAVEHASARKRAAETLPAHDDPQAATPAPPKAPTPSRPRPVTPRVAAVPAPTPADAPVAAPEEEAASNLPALPVAAPPMHEVVATAPPPAPPIGPFFETKDVNEPPKIAARVEPKVPEGLRARSSDEIVIVRALVSQSGHPSRVSLLRRSKAGPELDAVVVDAVNQWTFAPARKKGEAVSCWFNFGVPVGRIE